jgi:hypothetical protein
VKCNTHNLGDRTLFESILVPEVAKALKDWGKQTSNKGVLIGGLALSYYIKPRTTTDGDFLFLHAEDIPTEVPGFKRNRKGAFEHRETGVEVEVLTPASINMSPELAKQIIDGAITHGPFRVASKEGLIAAKLGRFSMRDRGDIDEMLQLGEVHMSKFSLSEKEQMNLEQALKDAK